MNTESPIFSNPFRPGAGHMPPYLAGRDKEEKEFHKLLQQKTILKAFKMCARAKSPNIVTPTEEKSQE